MKNIELNQISHVMMALITQPIVGATKFKALKIFKQIEAEMDTVRESVAGLDMGTQEYRDILNAENSVEFNTKFTQADLEPFSLSAGQILILEPLIEEVEEC